MSEIKGTNVIGPVVPFDTTDTHASHEAKYGKGGFRTVADTTERDAIPSARREAGMLVYVTAADTVYQLGGDLTTWAEFTVASVADWADITGKPSVFPPDTAALAAVATSNSYNDLSNKPTIPEAYVLPKADGDNLGGIIVGTGLDFFSNGKITVNYGTTTGTACRGNDSRLSDSRSPLSHTHPLSALTQSSATTGQVAAWNGTAWAPASPSSGATGPTGSAGAASTVTGPTGATGAPGAAGAASNVTGPTGAAGDSVTGPTGASGESITGPTGAGETGPTGPSPFNYRGAWDNFTAYGLYDAVTFDGELWWLPSTAGWSIGGTPPGYNWELILAKGVTGVTGPTGNAGESITGPTGSSGESITGPTGSPGSAGGQGVTGPTGPAGSGGGGGSSSASDLTSGTLADARLSANAQAAVSVFFHPFLIAGM